MQRLEYSNHHSFVSDLPLDCISFITLLSLVPSANPIDLTTFCGFETSCSFLSFIHLNDFDFYFLLYESNLLIFHRAILLMDLPNLER